MATVTVHDMRALKYCAQGSREFFKRHGLDWSLFIRAGIPVEDLEHIEDSMLARVIEHAKQREAEDGRQE